MAQLSRWFWRILTSFIVTAPVLLFCDWILPGFYMTSWRALILGLAVLALLNSFVRPVLVQLTVPINVFTFGIFGFILNGVTVLIAAAIVPGFYVEDLGSAIVLSIFLLAGQGLIANLILSENDRFLNEYATIKRFARKARKDQTYDTPGLIMLEIDGLSKPVFQRALATGYMPYLAGLIHSKQFRFQSWDTLLSSQTSAMQAGILHGTTHDISAFRFYDKKQKRLFVSNHAKDARDMLVWLSDGEGLLKGDGFSLNNWATGDADDVMLTFSGGGGTKMLGSRNNLYQFFANANNVQQVLFAAIRELWVERKEARFQKKRNVIPRIDRHMPYPLVRVGTNAVFPKLSTYLLIGKMFEGVESAYTTFVSYDEVSHHSGIETADSVKVLTQLDHQFEFVMRAAQETKRKYEFIILSDHGQTQGSTFLQRYGYTLGQLVDRLTGSKYATLHIIGGDEAAANINLTVSQWTQSGGFMANRARSILKDRADSEGNITLLEDQPKAETISGLGAEPEQSTIVVASGNLGLIYFTHDDERMTLEKMDAQFPGMIDALAHHEGIGFVMVRSEKLGTVCYGDKGVYYLHEDRFEGENPLATFGPHAALALKNVDGYDTCPDILVNSFYDPEMDEGAAFEELVGFHGGLGGKQNTPFIMYPTHFAPDGLPPIIGAPAVHEVIKGWKAQMAAGKNGTNV
jgi:uncharacterized membrane protein YvlD (DUF360 family)